MRPAACQRPGREIGPQLESLSESQPRLGLIGAARGLRACRRVGLAVGESDSDSVTGPGRATDSPATVPNLPQALRQAGRRGGT